MKKFLIGLLAIVGGFTLFSMLGLIIIAKVTQGQKQTIEPNTVLTIDFKGDMAEGSNQDGFFKLFRYNKDSLYDLVQTIDQASKDDRVKGIVARIDKASMGLAQAQELRNAIMRFRVLGRDKQKFTIAHADTYGEMSPGTVAYYLASAFEEVWVQPLGEVCFTGLYMGFPFAKDTLDTLGIKVQIDKREDYKNAMDFLMEKTFTKAHREAEQALLNSLMSQIVRDVALARELNENDIWDAVNKSPLVGTDALKLSLIDRQDYYDEIKPYVSSKISGDFKYMNSSKYLEANPLPEPSLGQNKIALIFGAGMIIRDDGDGESVFEDEIMNAERIRKSFEKAVQDEDVVAIVFRINSPGGSPVASETILRAARKAQQAGKPVIVSMSDLAASGGYWVSSFADHIVAHPSTITGSIGVFGGKFVTKETLEKIGINWENLHVGENADIWSSNDEYSTQGWEKLQGWLDHIYKAFIDRVAEGRSLPKEHVMQVAKGRVWSGEEALKYGLVDKLGDLKEAIELAKESVSLKDKIVPVEIFPKPKGFGETLQALFGDDDGLDASVSYPRMPFSSALNSLQRLYLQVYTFFKPGASTILAPVTKIEG